MQTALAFPRRPAARLRSCGDRPGLRNGGSGGTAAGARDALLAGFEAGRAYTNIHNAVFPGGEIRANLLRVSEPTSALLILSGVLGFAWIRRRRTLQ